MSPLSGIVVRGVLAGASYLAALEIDLRVTRNNVDDRVMLGGIAPISARSARRAGIAIHLGNSIAMSAVYSLLIRQRLNGPGWWRGLVFANLENTLLYPLALLEDYHPAIRDGRLDSYQSTTAFLQEVWRHCVFGIVLGHLARK